MLLRRRLMETDAPVSTVLSTRDRVTTLLGVFDTNTAIDMLLEQASAEAAAMLNYPEAETGGAWPLLEAGFTEELTFERPLGAFELDLHRRFLLTKPTVMVDGEMVDASEIVADLIVGLINRVDAYGAPKAWGGTAITASYGAGFATPEATEIAASSRKFPALLERAIIELIRFRYTTTTGNPCGGISQFSAPGAGSLVFDSPELNIVDGVPQGVAMALAPYSFQRARA